VGGARPRPPRRRGETGTLIGRSGVHCHRVWPDDPEVGWLIDTPWQGRGLAAEAGAASIRWGFDELGFGRVVSICTPDNLASRRVMEKLGLQRLCELDDPALGIRLWVHALEAACRSRPGGGVRAVAGAPERAAFAHEGVRTREHANLARRGPR